METTNFEPQNPIPDIQIPVLPSTPTPNKNIFKLLFFIFLGLFLTTLLFSTYLLVKISIKDQKSKAEIQTQIPENITPTETLSSTTTPTTSMDNNKDFKNYTDKKYGISFSYLNNFSFTDNFSTTNQIVNLLRTDCPNDGPSCADLTIYYYNNFQEFLNSEEIKSREAKSGTSLKDWISNNSDSIFFDIKEIELDNNKAFLVGDLGSAMSTSEIFVSKNQHIYQLVFNFINDNSSNTSDINPIFNTIISTFKFN